MISQTAKYNQTTSIYFFLTVNEATNTVGTRIKYRTLILKFHENWVLGSHVEKTWTGLLDLVSSPGDPLGPWLPVRPGRPGMPKEGSAGDPGRPGMPGRPSIPRSPFSPGTP